VVDALHARVRRDDEHQDDLSQWHREETEGSAARFLFATEGRRQRLRIPLSPAPVLTIHAEPPPRMADGSGILPAYPIAPVAVEVRLRPEPPSDKQVDDVRAWLRVHRPAREVTPRPEPAPPPAEPPAPVLEPLIALEPARRGSLWPFLACSMGLAAALLAAFLF